MTRISFGITDLDVGGAEKTLTELVLRLDRKKWSPSVVCMKPLGPLADRLSKEGVPIFSLGMRSVWQIPRALREWTAILCQQRPVLLQTFLFHANLLGRIAGRKAKIPRVVSGIRVAEHRASWHLLMDRWTQHLSDAHVCVSSQVGDFAAKHVGIDRNRLFVIPNGVDLDQAQQANAVDRSPLDLSGGRVMLLCIGRLDPQKGHDDLLAALEILSDRMPLAQRLLVMLIGEGPLRSSLERAVQKRGLETVIRFVGWQPNPLDWLAAADGLVQPSHWEGMANVVLEAMAAELPVISTAVEGTAELVLDGKTGWRVPSRSPDRLAKAIEEFLERPEDRRKFAEAGRRLVAQEYTYEKMVERYEELYRRLIV